MEADADTEHSLMIEGSVSQTMQIDPRRARFPCCIVWTPLPIISWLVPFIGHIGICREDGVILDFAGPNFVCVDNFAFGSVTRYLQISNEKVSTGFCIATITSVVPAGNMVCASSVVGTIIIASKREANYLLHTTAFSEK